MFQHLRVEKVRPQEALVGLWYCATNPVALNKYVIPLAHPTICPFLPTPLLSVDKMKLLRMGLLSLDLADMAEA
jgi:hypothetical protein